MDLWELTVSLFEHLTEKRQPWKYNHIINCIINQRIDKKQWKKLLFYLLL